MLKVKAAILVQAPSTVASPVPPEADFFYGSAFAQHSVNNYASNYLRFFITFDLVTDPLNEFIQLYQHFQKSI